MQKSCQANDGIVGQWVVAGIVCSGVKIIYTHVKESYNKMNRTGFRHSHILFHIGWQ